MRGVVLSVVSVTRAVSVLIGLALVGQPAFGFECFTVADSGNLLLSVDENTAAETLIGGTASRLEAIALDPSSGTLYGANAGQLGTLNQATGVFTSLSSSFGTGSGSVGNVHFSDVDGLAFSASTGVLWGSHRRSGSDVLLQIDPSSGAHVPNAFGVGIDYVVIAISGSGDVDDLAVDPVTDTLYAVVNDGLGVDAKLVTVDKNTGASVIIGNLLTGGGSQVEDMEGVGIAPDGTLYGTTGNSGPSSTDDRLWIIDKATAQVTLVGQLTSGSDYEAFDCNSEPPPTPTNTPLPTDTPVPPTDTPLPTDTPVPPTDTPLPTDTPVPPTDTPLPTDTPVPPTDTPLPTDTPVPPTDTPLPTDTPAPATDTPASTATATATATDTLQSTNTATPTDTPPVNTCGDGVVDPGEACDDGNGFAEDGCETDCTISSACNFIHAGTPAEVYVNDNTANDDITSPVPCASAAFTTIQDAIDAPGVGDGDIVWVCPGSYAQSVVVTKELTLSSTDGAATTSVTSGGVALDVRRSGVRIDGFTIDAAATAIEASSICPLGVSGCATARGSNLTVTRSTIQNSPQGISWTSRIDCSRVSLNTMTGNASHLDIDQQSGVPAFLTVVSQNAISGGGESGNSVRISGVGVFAVIIGNVIQASNGDGLAIASLPSGATIEENVIGNNAASGIVVLPGAATARIRQNNIEGNGVGLTNQAPEGNVGATLNWWGSQTGPFHAVDRPSGVGDEIVESGGLDTDFIEFLCAPAPGGFPSSGGECGGAEPQEELNFVAFGRSPDVSPNGRFIAFVSDYDLNRDAIVTIDNSDGGDEVFLLNRSPGGKPNAFCLGGTIPGLTCRRDRDCPANFSADPIVNEGVCVLLTQLSNDPTGTAIASAPRVTRNGTVFFSTDADLFGTNGDGSLEVHSWSRREFRKQKPTDPNSVVTMLSDGGAGEDSDRPGSDRGGRRRVFMQSNGDPLGTNGDGNTEIMLLDVKKGVWTQITDSTGTENARASTQTGRQVVFDSEADLTGQNADGNREIFLALFKRQAWVISQITDTMGADNQAGSLSKRGKLTVFSSDGDLVGQNGDGNREVFVWNKGALEQITNTTVGENVNPQGNPRGRFITFESTTDVEDGGTGMVLTNRRVHLFDRKFGTTLLLSRSFFGDNFVPRISQGRFVVWESTANLTGQNPSGDKSIYLFDRRKDD